MVSLIFFGARATLSVSHVVHTSITWQGKNMLWQRHWSSHVLTRRDFGQLRQHQALLKYIALWILETCVGQNVNSQNQGLVIRVARGSQSHIISMAFLFSKSSASDRFYKRSLGCNTKTLSLRDLFSIGELHKYRDRIVQIHWYASFQRIWKFWFKLEFL